MNEKKIECGEVERGVIAKRINAINAAQGALKVASELGNETFALFCGARGYPADTQFVRIEGTAVIVNVPAEPPSAE